MIRKPVHIITGFLGSGKTTFLNHFMRERIPERIFVIENECGSTNVDGGLIIEGVEEVVELSAGCLCCSLADGLLDILKAASKKSDQYDRLVIKTTGIADPGSIIQFFLEDPLVERFFELQQVICLVDAGLVEEWLDEAKESLQQVALSDVMLVNKVDTVSVEDVLRVQSVLNGINPHAHVYTGKEGDFPVEQILKIGTVKPESVESIVHHEHHHHEHGDASNNSHKITTFSISFPQSLDLNHLHQELNRIVKEHRDQIYRVKGFIAIPNCPYRVLLQSARSNFIVTDGSPWASADQREGKLVFIGRGLKKSEFEVRLSKFMVPLEKHSVRL